MSNCKICGFSAKPGWAQDWIIPHEVCSKNCLESIPQCDFCDELAKYEIQTIMGPDNYCADCADHAATCSHCRGTGEGMTEHNSCMMCKGRGYIKPTEIKELW